MSLAVLSTALCLGCGDTQSLFSDSEEWQQVESDFDARREALPDGDLFSIFDEELTSAQREALTFLYAYMPLADIVDHDGSYYLENVDYSLRAREEMPWGKDIPEREFRHFVLPVRVNNEDLDDSRKIFYEELRERVADMTLAEAVLEVNHWCHEKVIYTPSDARTTSPLASVKTAYGRCGEESTFTVAALRAIGIPARQVYTPRWAHTDDNHAWVEAWVDGEWCFFGACEPEPVLNLGWFNSAASRGMLMHTRVFGRYNGDEEVVARSPRNTEINVIDNYATTGRSDVQVVDSAGQPVPDASVEFKLYNYAEFHTVATKTTDSIGHTFLSAGRGDMLVWASKDGRFGYSKVSFGKDSLVTITLDKQGGESYEIELDIVPPAENANLPEVSAEQRTENDRRMAEEDSIRNAYVSTFETDSTARVFARAHNLDEETVARLLPASRGNHETITEFLASLSGDEEKELGLRLLSVIAQKDLRDVTLEVLKDHLDNTTGDKQSAYFNDYILNPRIDTELLTPYKSFFLARTDSVEQRAFLDDPAKLVKWVADSITVDPDCNLGACPISPAGVWRARVSNRNSRDIFFVAYARSMGIPARIDEVTGKVQFVGKAGEWVDVNFDGIRPAATPKGRLVAHYTPTKILDDPNYYAHFTISKITDKGSLQLMNYEEGELDMGGGTSWSNLLKNGTRIDAGNYLLVTGTRLANGGVLARITSFSVEEGKTTTLDLTMREPTDEIAVIGSFNSESLYRPLDSEELTSVLSTTGRGYFVVAVLGVGEEPTNHALRDIAALSGKFEEWGRPMLFLFPSEQARNKYNPDEFKGLPSTITYGIDSDGSIQKQIAEGMKLTNKSSLPMFIIGDTFNRVVFVQQGYTIGLGEQLINVINKL